MEKFLQANRRMTLFYLQVAVRKTTLNNQRSQKYALLYSLKCIFGFFDYYIRVFLFIFVFSPILSCARIPKTLWKKF